MFPERLWNILSDPGPSITYCYLALDPWVDVPCILLLTRVIVHIKNSECTLCINVCQDCLGMQNTELDCPSKPDKGEALNTLAEF